MTIQPTLGEEVPLLWFRRDKEIDWDLVGLIVCAAGGFFKVLHRSPAWPGEEEQGSPDKSRHLLLSLSLPLSLPRYFAL